MSRQKRIAIINDITGFGRCSTAVELPLISALKVQACPLPTAILSVHTGFPNYYLHDFTPYMKDYMDSWARTGLAFDGILTGFLSSPAQIGLISQCIKLFKKPGTLVIVDPVMGDYGRLYASYTDELCRDMCQLLEHWRGLWQNGCGVTKHMKSAGELMCRMRHQQDTYHMETALS